MALNVQSRHTLDGKFTSPLDLETPAVFIAANEDQDYNAGTGSQQGDQWFTDSRTLAATSETLDLTSSLTNAFGVTCDFASIKEIWVANTSTTSTENLTLSGNAMLGLMGNATHEQVVRPKGIWVVSSPVDGFTITNTTGDQLTINAGSDTITYRIWILGVNN